MENRRDDATREPTAPPETTPRIAIVGAGAVGTALGVAMARAGVAVTAIASRDEARRERFAGLVPGVLAVDEPAAAAAEADIVILTVPDDAVGVVAAALRLAPAQTLVHTSGLLGMEVLRTAGSPEALGPAVGAFHPLVSFTSDVERSVAALHGATVALEGDDRACGQMTALAEAIGAVPLQLPPGARPVYHAGAVMASAGLVALLDAVAALGAAAGLDEATSLAVYGRLTEQTLANAKTAGIAAALTGPIVRGDAGTIAGHLAAIRKLAPGVAEIYLATARRELRIAEGRGALSPDQAGRMRDVLAKDR